MAGSLPRAAGEFITLVQLLRQASDAALPDARSLRAQLIRLLEGLPSAPGNEETPADEIDEARFALAAWADECVLRSNWWGRAEWQFETLQMALYRTSKAGNEFFEHLQRLRPEQTFAREAYFLVLALGFEGQYAGQEAERRALLDQQYEMLRATGRYLETTRDQPLSPEAYDLEIDVQGRGRGGVLRGLGLMALGVVATYGVLWAILQYFGTQVPVSGGG